MCLAIPLALTEIKGAVGIVEMNGIKRRVILSLVDNPKVGDYIVVHAGFAITIMDKEEAEKTLQVIRECIEKEENE